MKVRRTATWCAIAILGYLAVASRAVDAQDSFLSSTSRYLTSFPGYEFGLFFANLLTFAMGVTGSSLNPSVFPWVVIMVESVVQGALLGILLSAVWGKLAKLKRAPNGAN